MRTKRTEQIARNRYHDPIYEKIKSVIGSQSKGKLRNRYHDPIYEKIKSVLGSQSKGKLQCERNEQSR